MAHRALSGRQLRARLISAKGTAVANGRTVREQLEQELITAVELSSSGSIASTSVGSNSVQKSSGSLTVTDVDLVDSWELLLNLWNTGYQWVKWCFTYGLDPQDSEDNQVDTPPTGGAVANPTEISDDYVYEWLMGSTYIPDSPRNWVGKIQPLTECRSDYATIKTGAGLQWT